MTTYDVSIQAKTIVVSERLCDYLQVTVVNLLPFRWKRLLIRFPYWTYSSSLSLQRVYSLGHRDGLKLAYYVFDFCN